MMPDTGLTREEERQAERLRTALDYLYARDLSRLPTPTDAAADDLANVLWRVANGDGDAPESLVNACYRALENAE